MGFWSNPRVLIERRHAQDQVVTTLPFGDEVGAAAHTEVSQFAWARLERCERIGTLQPAKSRALDARGRGERGSVGLATGLAMAMNDGAGEARYLVGDVAAQAGSAHVRFLSEEGEW